MAVSEVRLRSMQNRVSLPKGVVLNILLLMVVVEVVEVVIVVAVAVVVVLAPSSSILNVFLKHQE